VHHGIHKNIETIILEHQISILESFMKDTEEWRDDAENSALPLPE